MKSYLPLLCLAILGLLSPPLARSDESCRLTFHDLVARLDAAQSARATSTVRVDLDATGGPAMPFSEIPWPRHYGEKVEVQLYVDGQHRDSIPQLVFPEWILDAETRQAVADLRRSSFETGRFTEAGIWLLYTARGVYRSDILVSDRDDRIENHLAGRAFDQALARVRRAEGEGAELEDIEFLHTHPDSGEPLSSGDVSYLGGAYRAHSRLLRLGGRISAYAVPVAGETLFRRTYVRKE